MPLRFHSNLIPCVLHTSLHSFIKLCGYKSWDTGCLFACYFFSNNNFSPELKLIWLLFYFFLIPRLRLTESWDQCISGCLNPCMYVKLCSRGSLVSSAPSRPLRKAKCMLPRIRPQWMSASAFSSRGSMCFMRKQMHRKWNILNKLKPSLEEISIIFLQIIFILSIYFLNSS